MFGQRIQTEGRWKPWASIYSTHVSWTNEEGRSRRQISFCNNTTQLPAFVLLHFGKMDTHPTLALHDVDASVLYVPSNTRMAFVICIITAAERGVPAFLLGYGCACGKFRRVTA